ncbi:MAG: bifunctional phosphopantothenoylcysteine decarboxylase/phosphopantothenate--cysteine ligase CoaBC [Cellvibrionaceae bacterium]
MSGPQSNSLHNKRILLGVTGGIAAYKSADLVRRLQDAGATVQVAMTRAATEFVTPLTFQALSGFPVHLDLLNEEAERSMGHIQLARWADLILVAPATADFIARLAHGEANDLLSAVCLATTAPIAIAPAMNQAMWANPATQANLQTLRDRKHPIFGPASGSQACGDIGQGRMLEPLELVDLSAAQFQSQLLAGKRVVITAGPTREAIDPVRYISNHSSGKMGFALAQACVEAGAQVTLIAGPVNLPTPEQTTRVDVVSAEDMLTACESAVESEVDIFIGSAAVADYRPLVAADQKLKKQHSGDAMSISLTQNPDIIATIANHEAPPFMVGFAAETQNVAAYARDKFQRKKLDMVIANDVSNPDIGFNSENNAVTLVCAEGDTTLGLRSKSQLAQDIVTAIASRLNR